jgi:hypothetical protein
MARPYVYEVQDLSCREQAIWNGDSVLPGAGPYKIDRYLMTALPDLNWQKM